MLVMAQVMRSGMEAPPWSMRAAARNGGSGMQFLIALLLAFVRIVILETSAESFREVQEAQVGYLVSVVLNRTSLLSCAGKADSPVPTRAKTLAVGMVLVPPTLEK